MNTMASVFISLFVATICIGFTIGDPTAKVTFKKIDLQVADNPYFGALQAEIHPPGEALTFKVPVMKDIPDTMMMKGTAQYAGSEIGEVDMTMCEAFKDEVFGKSLLDAGIPKGKFPRACPIKSSGDYVISKYKAPIDPIPPGLPDGPVSADVIIYEPGKDPYVTIRFEAELGHKIPGLGR